MWIFSLPVNLGCKDKLFAIPIFNLNNLMRSSQEELGETLHNIWVLCTDTAACLPGAGRPEVQNRSDLECFIKFLLNARMSELLSSL